ncbi:TonB-dependent receptor plug domain-containing protein [Pelagicoccus mobilis]|uniref:TonB-dependent receptor plug domain-containing protein n=1 Tax=Pelagicoccus mobilis TaxID=415221 RepID=A0A934RZ61_9BACT|nr:TonB-dependent receptor plug domain-containing protein [Pelagicoccus mobilis]MBK1876519.1 hypothetical protein [Pelagicoccus mobilis]
MMTSHRKLYPTISGTLALALAGAAGLNAQDEEDEVFELSPFTVDGSKDTGYYASETLSGTQLRTNMRTLANPVTVLTEEMLRDIGALSYEDAVEFLPSTTSYQGNVADNDGNVARTGTPYTSRGFRVNALTQNFLSTNVRQDSYNTERLTQSRGPNSLLFGLGSVGGSMNTSAKRGRTHRDEQTYEMRFDDYGGTRYTIDLNKVLVDDKLAFRFASIYEDKRTHLPAQYRRRKSAYGNLTYRLSEKTEFNFNGEIGRFDELNPRPFLTKDFFSPWENAVNPDTGVPYTDWEKANRTYTRPDGTINASGAAQNNLPQISKNLQNDVYYVWIANDPDAPVLNWARKGQSRNPTINGSESSQVSITNPQLTDEVYFPLDTAIGGFNDHYDYDYDKYGVTIEHQFFKNTHMQLMYANETRDIDDARPVKRQNYAIRIDNNWWLPGTGPADENNIDMVNPSNPYFGLPYIESSGFRLESEEEMEQYRASLSHTQHLGDSDLLGKISLVGTYYKRETERFTVQLDEMNMVPNRRAGNGTGFYDGNFTRSRLNRRYYLTGSNSPSFPSTPLEPITQSADLSSGSPRWPTSTVPGTMVIPEVNSQWVSRLNPIHIFEDTESESFLAQWTALNERLILTGGTRKDTISGTNAVYTRNPETKIFDGEPVYPEITENSVRNHNYGVVVKASQYFDFYANESTNNVSAGTQAYTIFNEQLPDQEGEGYDFGIRNFLFDDKLVVKLNYFENTLLHEINNPLRDGLARAGSPIDDFLDGMAANGLHDMIAGSPVFEDYTGNGLWSDVQNTETEGYELEAVFNPTSNLRMMLNVSRNETVVNDTYIFSRPWFEAYIDPVVGTDIEDLFYDGEPPSADPADDAGRETIGDIVERITDKVARHDAQVGGPMIRSNLWQVNFVSSYGITEGKLKGSRIGGAARWRSAPTIGYKEDEIGNFISDQPLKGYEVFFADVFYTYSGKGGIFGKDSRWDATLRVRNIFDDDGWSPRTALDDGNGYPYYLQMVHHAPRSFELSLRLRY